MKALRIISLLALLPLLGTGASWAVEHCPVQPKHVILIAKSGGEQGPASLAVHPAVVVVRQGCSLEIWIPPGSKVKTDGGEGNDWLTKTSQGTAPIVISVALDQALGLYKYKIELEDFGTLDPYVRVTK